MTENLYLKWLGETSSYWWCDSAVPDEVAQALENGATGVTTNPLLVYRALLTAPNYWRPRLRGCETLEGDARIEEIIRRVTVPLAELLSPVYEATRGVQGYVCAQVNPMLAGNRQGMLEMALRLAAWAPNIAVKLPATAASLDVMEECAAAGITTVGTVSFTAAQAVAIAQRQQAGIDRARGKSGRAPAAFAVVMVGRLDDYLRDVAMDGEVPLEAGDVTWAGTAAIKAAYAELQRQGLAAKLMPAGMRGAYHVLELAGADMSMSLSVGIQEALAQQSAPFATRINTPVPPEVLTRLRQLPEFMRAWQLDGMEPAEFITFGATQKTLSQFIEAGWSRVGEFPL